MRNVEYLSPSAVALYLQSPVEYYRRYLCDKRPDREPQTQAMSIGSAFDAYAKAYLYKMLVNRGDERYELRTIFEAQVEEQWRDWAWKHGEYVFNQYKQSGCLADLMLLLKGSVSEPRFEFEVRGSVSGYREGMEGKFGQVVLLGKPDVDFVTADGVHVILDFKVNGYCSNYSVTPKPGYLRLRSAGNTHYGEHKSCKAFAHKGMMVNFGSYLEHVDEGWARQLAIYGWLCGNPVGSEFVTIIHQLACDGRDKTALPAIRVAEHVTLISKEFQQKVFGQVCDLWEIVHSDWFFRDKTREDSQALCEMLNNDTGDMAWML
jgi:hypothetical protein